MNPAGKKVPAALGLSVPIGLLALIGLLVAIPAAACGDAEIPGGTTPAPTGLATPKPPLAGSTQAPSILPKGPDGAKVPAPIESVEIERLAARPPNATLIVVSGLRSACETFSEYSLTREGEAFQLQVTNFRPDMDCPATYETVTTRIFLDEYGIEACHTYIVVVNGEAHSVQASCPAIAGGPGATDEATPTPSPIREWNLEGIQVDGSTGTVLLRVYAGIDVRVALDDERADEVRPTIPIIEYVFLNVTPGQHTVEVQDVVGHGEKAEVVVATSSATPDENPEWLGQLIQRLGNEPVANPPLSITQYGYRGQTVYFVPQRCCDIFSDLYDAEGKIIGHPDGGITGRGDGRVPDFFGERNNEQVVWEDQRTHGPSLVQDRAPIEGVEVLDMEGSPPQYSLAVASGLPNGCVSFAGYRLERDGDIIRIEMVNWKPADPQVTCAQVYGTVETMIALGSDFESGKMYTVVVNDVTETFVAQ